MKTKTKRNVELLRSNSKARLNLPIEKMEHKKKIYRFTQVKMFALKIHKAREKSRAKLTIRQENRMKIYLAMRMPKNTVLKCINLQL